MLHAEEVVIGLCGEGIHSALEEVLTKVRVRGKFGSLGELAGARI